MQTRTKRRAIRLVGLLLLAALFLSCTPAGVGVWRWLGTVSGFGDWPQEPELMEVHIMDVGKADAILIRCGSRSALLDAGHGVSAESVD